MVNDTLVLPNVGRQDSGEYICSASNSMGITEVTIMLDVESESHGAVGVVLMLSCLNPLPVRIFTIIYNSLSAY